MFKENFVKLILVFDFRSFFGLDFLKFSGPLCSISFHEFLLTYIFLKICAFNGAVLDKRRLSTHFENLMKRTIERNVTRCFCGYLTKFFEKMPKSPIFWRKMYNSGNSGWNWISVLPDRRVTRHEHFWSNIGDFWLFLKKFGEQCAIFVWLLTKLWHSCHLAKTCLFVCYYKTSFLVVVFLVWSQRLRG